MIENIKPIKKYEIAVDWHLERLKKAIMTHYKDINLNKHTFAYMDKLEIEKINESLKTLINQCKELEEKEIK